MHALTETADGLRIARYAVKDVTRIRRPGR